MPKVRSQAFPRVRVPQADGRVQRAGEDVAGWQWAIAGREARAVGFGGGVIGGLLWGRGDGAAGGGGGAVVVVDVGVFFEFEVVGQSDDLLDLADVAFKCFDAGLAVDVPELDGAVIRGGEDGP